MSRWRNDPEAAAARLISGCLESIDGGGRVLVANPPAGGELSARLAERGDRCDVWERRLGEEAHGVEARPWPPTGPFDAVLLRLPPAKDERAMAAHATLSVLAPTGRLIVYGGNEEGIRSSVVMLARLCGEVETLAARGHGRVLAVRRPVDLSPIRGALSCWRLTTPVVIGGTARPWVSYPGVFAAGRIDAATRLLIGALPELPRGARLLDFGCGSGAIGASALARMPGVALDMLDNDAVALAAARENVPEGRPILAARLSDAPAGYDAILSNPPLHRGIAEDHRALSELITEAPRHLTARGVLQIVVQRRVPVLPLLRQRFARVSVTAQTEGYRIVRAERC
jgi:16S rRNA (guanine1207-N2)-methyltransferase